MTLHPTPKPGAPESGASPGSGEPTPGNGEAAESGGGFDIEKAFTDFQAKVFDKFDHLDKKHGTLVDDFVKMRKRINGAGDTKPSEPKGEPKASEAEPNGGGGSSSYALQARLTKTLAKLPDAKQDEAIKRLEEGGSIEHELLRAEMLLEGMGLVESTDPSTGKEPTIPGKAASAPAQLSSGAFANYKAWSDFRKQNPNGAVDFKRQNPEFDPFKLPGAPRRTWSFDET